MTDIDLINKVLNANSPSDIFTSDFKKEYIRFSKLIHPDHCKHPSASDAMAKLSTFKDELNNGITHTDDSGPLKRFDKKIVYNVTDKNENLLKKSVENYKLLKSKATSKTKNFLNYLPDHMTLTNRQLVILFKDRTVPLIGHQFEQKHVNWVFSRLFEFSLWVQQVGFSHMGLNPETIYVVPETHGIICTSFYHLTPLFKKANTVSTRFKNWYPTILFSEKIATPDIDLELSKKIALYLLGDKSGAGTKLRRDKNVNQNMLNFLLTKHKGEFVDYDEYRQLLAKNFQKKFYTLTI